MSQKVTGEFQRFGAGILGGLIELLIEAAGHFALANELFPHLLEIV